jgi:hypothetical protein
MREVMPQVAGMQRPEGNKKTGQRPVFYDVLRLLGRLRTGRFRRRLMSRAVAACAPLPSKANDGRTQSL